MLSLNSVLSIKKPISLTKNGGLCLDENGTKPFRCDCLDRFSGENCANDLCTDVNCGEGEFCFIETKNNFKEPKCGYLCTAENCIDGICTDGRCIETCSLNPCKEMHSSFYPRT